MDTCSDFRVMRTEKALLKKEARSGLRGASLVSRKEYNLSSRTSSPQIFSLTWHRRCKF
jgi:hypothetical protein